MPLARTVAEIAKEEKCSDQHVKNCAKMVLTASQPGGEASGPSTDQTQHFWLRRRDLLQPIRTRPWPPQSFWPDA